MSIEKNGSIARPRLPRASDLREVPAAGERRPQRDATGRFLAGNGLAYGRRWKAAIKHALGSRATEGEAGKVAADAWFIFAAVIATLPSDAAPVRSLAALHARHVALASFYTEAAARAGLDSDRGLVLQAEAARQSARAERTLVTALDVATRLASAAPAAELPEPWERPRPPVEPETAALPAETAS
jgi:hypothetical protein